MTARWVERWNGGRVAIAPWQAWPAAMKAGGLTPADTREKVWFVPPAEPPKGGAAAINAAVRGVSWLRPFTWLYTLPGIGPLEEAVYRWVARHRHLLPGVTPACEAGADCKD